MREKFYICRHCGNIVAMVHNAGVPVLCCGTKMEELVPNTVDASNEKHLPAVTVEGSKVTVTVGTVTHPMTEQHWIQWIRLETKKGSQMRLLTPDDAPAATFTVAEDDVPVAVASYCNLHGLWVTEL